MLFIEPNSPWENGCIESLNGKLRDEILNRESFDTLTETKAVIETWRRTTRSAPYLAGLTTRTRIDPAFPAVIELGNETGSKLKVSLYFRCKPDNGGMSPSLTLIHALTSNKIGPPGRQSTPEHSTTDHQPPGSVRAARARIGRLAYPATVNALAPGDVPRKGVRFPVPREPRNRFSGPRFSHRKRRRLPKNSLPWKARQTGHI